MTPLLRTRRTAAAALALTAALMLTACNSTDNSAPPAPGAPTGTSAPAQFTTVSGSTVSVPGEKPTAVFFFSVGCGACVGGAKALAGAAEKLGSAASFVLVDMNPGESAQTVTGFQSDTGTQAIPAVIDTGATLTTRYSVAALSTLLVIDPSGKVSYRATDPSTDQITDALRKAGAA
ncbi:TlpA family protein disulfide reductase [Rhodococcus qingshengii]|uniref:TlpA family protein disulfide reductase n=1 Tax=Actinomycetes TaxID=1760 RepID=UPI00067EB13A|nr:MULTISPECIES: redoxin family protein [Rhodococcus]MDV8128866.1 redoxin family protein [Rhodococcus sp. IEGM 1304]OXM18084.1 mercury transporter [Rhodococcus erythropolis]